MIITEQDMKEGVGQHSGKFLYNIVIKLTLMKTRLQ